MKSNSAPPSGRLVGAIGATAAAALMGALYQWEGNRNVGYADIVGVPTACQGVTRDANGNRVIVGKRYTDAECREMNEREALVHVQGAIKAVPALGEGCPQRCRRPYQIAAAGSLAYNIGIGAFAKSSVARLWNQGRWPEGCTAFEKWNKAGGRVVRGLTLRRVWENRKLCRVGL